MNSCSLMVRNLIRLGAEHNDNGVCLLQSLELGIVGAIVLMSHKWEGESVAFSPRLLSQPGVRE